MNRALPRTAPGTPVTPMPNEAADRINHHVAECLRELQRLGEDGMDVIEQAELGHLLMGFKDEINRRRA